MTFPNAGKYVVAWPRIAGVGENHVLFKRLDEIILSFVSERKLLTARCHCFVCFEREELGVTVLVIV